MQDSIPKQQESDKITPKKLSKRARSFSKIKRRFLKHVWLARVVILAAILGLLYLVVLVTGLIFRNTAVSNFFETTSSFVFTPKEKIQSIEGRTNILIMGKGGVGHNAPDLTDTVIFASFSHKDPSIILISLPRDIWIPELRAKLNSIYYWGNQKEEKGGITLAKSTVEEIVGRPIHYGVVLDFTGFTKLIDVLGGIEIEVERAFVDKRYPIPGRENDECDGDLEYQCRYETIHYNEGRQIMGGETALKFVRSRNAEGDEGTDLARAVRQEKVIVAIKEKILSPKILFSLKKISGIFRVARESLETDVDVSAGAILARRALQAKDGMKTHVLPEEFLINPPKSVQYDSLYVFIPKDGDWEEIHKWVDCQLDKKCN
jgi:LCP family protein required for cell wall assembly